LKNLWGGEPETARPAQLTKTPRPTDKIAPLRTLFLIYDRRLRKPTMLTESFGRGSRADDPAKRRWDDPKGDSLHSVLRGVNGCLAGAEKTVRAGAC
jgi:hypothetical protein